MKLLLHGLWVVASLGLAAAAPAQQPANPAAKWGLNSKECSLWRSYGSGRAKARLGIRPALSWESARIFIIYQGASVPNRWAKGQFRAGNGPQVPIDFIDFPSTGAGERFIKLELPAAIMQAAMKAPSWQVSGERLREFDFPLDGLQSVSPALQRCVIDQASRLGFDQASLARVVHPPRVDLLKYFGTGDYPLIAANLGISGRTTVRLLVRANGKVEDCYVKQGSGNAVLDYVTCETFIKEVKFAPGRDANGQSIASTTVMTVAWEMPQDKKAR